jgi:hypothetical protein
MIERETMIKIVSWIALTAGTLILLFYAGIWIGLAVAMQPLGGIPVTLDFFQMNPRLTIMPAIGLILLAVGLNLLVRNRAQDAGQKGNRMRNGVKWAVLMLGFLILVYVGSVLLRLAKETRDHGGIPWSWDFILSNLTGLVILPLLGLTMVVTAFVLLVRNGR